LSVFVHFSVSLCSRGGCYHRFRFFLFRNWSRRWTLITLIPWRWRYDSRNLNWISYFLKFSSFSFCLFQQSLCIVHILFKPSIFLFNFNIYLSTIQMLRMVFWFFLEDTKRYKIKSFNDTRSYKLFLLFYFVHLIYF
jgi:hypothetical protein